MFPEVVSLEVIVVISIAIATSQIAMVCDVKFYAIFEMIHAWDIMAGFVLITGAPGRIRTSKLLLLGEMALPDLPTGV